MVESYFVRVAGVSKYQAAVCTVRDGDRCRLQPEPTNQYDPNAIMVLTDDGRQLGYIPKEQTGSILDALRAGCQITATVRGTGVPGTSEHVGIRLELDFEFPA